MYNSFVTNFILSTDDFTTNRIKKENSEHY